MLLLALLQVNGQYVFRHLTTGQGLSSKNTRCVLKDRDGFIWIGTVNGLNRFDGSDIITFQSGDSNTSLSENYVLSLFQQSNGTIWVGTRNGGVNLLDPTSLTFTAFFHDINDGTTISGDESKMVYEDKHGRIWLAVIDEGLDRFNPEDSSFSNFKPTDQFPDLTSRLANSILCAETDPEDEQCFWLGSLQGIFRFHPETQQWEHFPVDKQHAVNTSLYSGREMVVRDMMFDRDKKLWFTSWGGGLCRLDPLTGMYEIFKFEPLMPVNGFRNNLDKIIRKNDHELWLTVPHKGLVVFNIRDKAFRFVHELTTGEVPLDLPVGLIFDSQSGLLGIPSSNDGFFYTNVAAHQFQWNDMPFHIHSFGSSDDNRYIWAANYARYGNLIRIRKDDGSYRLFSYEPANNRAENFFTAIYNADDRLWLAEHFDLYFMDKKEMKIRKYPYFDPEPMLMDTSHIHNFISSTMDSGGHVWMGSKFHGLFRIDPENRTAANYYFRNPGDHYPFIEDFVFTLFTDSQGRTWYGSKNLGYFDPAKDAFVTFSFSGDLSESPVNVQYIYDFAETPDGNLWIATQHSGIAVMRVEGDSVSFVNSYTRRDGLISDNIARLAIDHQGNVWALTNTGLIRIFPGSGSVENYGREYGIAGINCIHAEADGGIWLGGNGGYFHFNPENVKELFPPHRPYIKSFRIFDREIDFRSMISKDSRISLGYDQNFFSIEYGDIHYFQADKTRFYYMLEGVDEDWQDAGNRRYISYANVDGGDYVFRLKVNDTKEIEVPLFIATPFWETGWFYGIIAALVALAIFFGHRYRMIQIRKEEKLKADFNKKISQLEIKALRAQMNPHFIFNSLNSIRYYILKDRNQDASEYITKFSRLLRLILSNSRQNQISLKDELHALRIYIDFEQMRFSKKFDAVIDVDDQIDLERTRIQPMTIQPFVENAIWHGLMPKENERKLMIDVRKNEKYLYIVVEDNGVGRHRAEQLKKSELTETKSYGLRITEDRMNVMKTLEGKQSDFEIIDLHDDRGDPCGTRVVIKHEI